MRSYNDSTRTVRARRDGSGGVRTSRRANGARCARTTAPVAPRGTTSPTITPARVPTAGARTASAGSATAGSTCASRIALWNGNDPILKERLFGLTNAEGNHGEDVKEYWWPLDSTPTHSWMRWLYKYPQRAFPYDDLVDENRGAAVDLAEYELVDTGVFDDDRYFDVEFTYAKVSPDDICIVIEARTVVPTPHRCTSCRRCGSATPGRGDATTAIPGSQLEATTIEAIARLFGHALARRLKGQRASHAVLRQRDQRSSVSRARAQRDAVPEGRHQRPRRSTAPRPSTRPTVRHERRRLVPPRRARGRDRARSACGSATCAPRRPVRRGRSTRRSRPPASRGRRVLSRSSHRAPPGSPLRDVQRRAIAGLLWAKKHYRYDVHEWLEGDPAMPPPPPARENGRNSRLDPPLQRRHHLDARRVGVPVVRGVGPRVPHAPAGDSSIPSSPRSSCCCSAASGTCTRTASCPPTSGRSTTSTRPCTRGRRGASTRSTPLARGKKDTEFLERIFHKLLINFSWWVNRKDAEGHNVFEGGFLGLDNIGLFDRSRAAPDGGRLAQSDATSAGWRCTA